MTPWVWDEQAVKRFKPNKKAAYASPWWEWTDSERYWHRGDRWLAAGYQHGFWRPRDWVFPPVGTVRSDTTYQTGDSEDTTFIATTVLTVGSTKEDDDIRDQLNHPTASDATDLQDDRNLTTPTEPDRSPCLDPVSDHTADVEQVSGSIDSYRFAFTNEATNEAVTPFTKNFEKLENCLRDVDNPKEINAAVKRALESDKDQPPPMQSMYSPDLKRTKVGPLIGEMVRQVIHAVEKDEPMPQDSSPPAAPTYAGSPEDETPVPLVNTMD